MILSEKVDKGTLKPCPFCGCAAGLYQAYNSFWQVQCNVCGIGTLRTTDKEFAISTWNKRAYAERKPKTHHSKRRKDNA